LTQPRKCAILSLLGYAGRERYMLGTACFCVLMALSRRFLCWPGPFCVGAGYGLAMGVARRARPALIPLPSPGLISPATSFFPGLGLSSSGPATGEGWVCQDCGRSYSSGGRCPACGGKLVPA